MSAAEYQQMQETGTTGLNYHFGLNGKLDGITPSYSDENSYQQDAIEYEGYLYDQITEEYIILQRQVTNPITQEYAGILMGLYNKGNNININGSSGGLTRDQFLFNFGLIASTVQTASGVTRFGSNLRFYSATESGGVFLSNQFVKTIGIAKVAKVLGIAGAVVGEGFDIYGYFAGTGTGAVPGDKLAMDSFMTAVGLTGFGTLPALVYFGVDAYYPGGFPAAVKNATPLYNQLNQPSAAPVQALMGMP